MIKRIRAWFNGEKSKEIVKYLKSEKNANLRKGRDKIKGIKNRIYLT